MRRCLESSVSFKLSPAAWPAQSLAISRLLRLEKVKETGVHWKALLRSSQVPDFTQTSPLSLGSMQATFPVLSSSTQHRPQKRHHHGHMPRLPSAALLPPTLSSIAHLPQRNLPQEATCTTTTTTTTTTKTKTRTAIAAHNHSIATTTITTTTTSSTTTTTANHSRCRA